MLASTSFRRCGQMQTRSISEPHQIGRTGSGPGLAGTKAGGQAARDARDRAEGIQPSASAPWAWPAPRALRDRQATFLPGEPLLDRTVPSSLAAPSSGLRLALCTVTEALLQAQTPAKPRACAATVTAIAQELGGEAIALPALAALLDTVTGLAERADAITLRQVLAALAEVTEPPRPDPRRVSLLDALACLPRPALRSGETADATIAEVTAGIARLVLRSLPPLEGAGPLLAQCRPLWARLPAACIPGVTSGLWRAIEEIEPGAGRRRLLDHLLDARATPGLRAASQAAAHLVTGLDMHTVIGELFARASTTGPAQAAALLCVLAAKTRSTARSRKDHPREWNLAALRPLPRTEPITRLRQQQLLEAAAAGQQVAREPAGALRVDGPWTDAERGQLAELAGWMPTGASD